MEASGSVVRTAGHEWRVFRGPVWRFSGMLQAAPAVPTALLASAGRAKVLVDRLPADAEIAGQGRFRFPRSGTPGQLCRLNG